MNKTFSALSSYLKKENIIIDEVELEFQILSHPEPDSILAISDALNFFNIENVVTRVDFSNLEELPNNFLALLHKERKGVELNHIEKIENDRYILNKNNPQTKSESFLEERWTRIVLLANSNNDFPIKKRNSFSWLIPVVSFAIIFLCIILSERNSSDKLFVLIPFIGIIFSTSVFKELFGIDNKLVDSFCNITTSTSCKEIINSSKWKVFNYLKFSDLSIVFFASQFIYNILFLIFSEQSGYMLLQKNLVIISIPLILISLYYQKFVEKKWCPICISISLLLIFEVLYFFIVDFENQILIKDLLVLIGTGLFVSTTWFFIKNQLLKIKELKEFQYKALRFKKNYDLFKTNLISKKKIELPHNAMQLGDIESKTIITLISNPFCGHCKEAHQNIEKLLIKSKFKICVQIILKTNFNFESDENKNVFRTLLDIYHQEGELKFNEAIKNWYQVRNTQKWLESHHVLNKSELSPIDTTLNDWHKWCSENKIQFTPTIFVNGYEYPQIYDRGDLEFFINDLIEDIF
ncbi:vitamin K epoxide reductase family protein [Flavobacterium terrisoli]|uniref:vitamin K epoxide reductase family protein n=1 Tax=Flavobacterium terrisoli TaxID=3242195 RepID=UPI0025436F60|nr:vitamin K epoxide reductase family protein [Flavobacterium buctense]